MLRIIDRIVEAFAVAAFVISSGFMFLNVINRYLVLGLLRIWAANSERFRPAYVTIRNALGTIVVTADEVPGLSLVWIAFLGAYLAMRKKGHIAFDLVIDSLSGGLHKIVSTLHTMLIVGFLALLFVQSIRMIQIAGTMEIETVAIAQGWFMLILPIAAALLTLASMLRLHSRWNGE